MVMIAWRGTESGSVEKLDLTLRSEGYRARSIVDLGPERVEYAVDLSPAWEFMALALQGSRSRALEVAHADGVWLVDGVPRPDLNAAVDIDLAFSPFTNTLPIRRLALADGGSADIVTAYVDAGLEVSPDRQRYTRLAADLYRYEALDRDFAAEITVDADGLVVDYPRRFTRTP